MYSASYTLRCPEQIFLNATAILFFVNTEIQYAYQSNE